MKHFIHIVAPESVSNAVRAQCACSQYAIDHITPGYISCLVDGAVRCERWQRLSLDRHQLLAKCVY